MVSLLLVGLVRLDIGSEEMPDAITISMLRQIRAKSGERQYMSRNIFRVNTRVFDEGKCCVSWDIEKMAEHAVMSSCSPQKSLILEHKFETDVGVPLAVAYAGIQVTKYSVDASRLDRLGSIDWVAAHIFHTSNFDAPEEIPGPT